jgi:hypothetical protein
VASADGDSLDGPSSRAYLRGCNVRVARYGVCMSKGGRSRDRQVVRERVGSALDRLPLEYVLDEVVRRVAGTGSGELVLRYRDGFVVGRQILYTKPSEADRRAIGVAYRTRLRTREIERRGG